MSTKKIIRFAQFTDSHLFAERDKLHYGANVFQNLQRVLANLAAQTELDFIVFTGDLSQDHHPQSYQLFVDAVVDAGMQCPVYYLSGNHDDPALLTQYLAVPPFCQTTYFSIENWQFFLLASKTNTPAGVISESTLQQLTEQCSATQFQFLLLHHHPIDVGYFIDRHGLANQQQFWQRIQPYPSIKAIACGHVHRALQITEPSSGTVLYTCPATSIQFDPAFDGIRALTNIPGYRLFTLSADGQVQTQVVYITE